MQFNPYVWSKEELEEMLLDAKEAYKEMIKEGKQVTSFTSLGTSVTTQWNSYSLEKHIQDLQMALSRYYPEKYGKPVKVGKANYTE